MPFAYVGMGSNVNREENIRSGIRELRSLGKRMLISSVYESEAFGFDGDFFYNLAIGLETAVSPAELNALLRAIEDRHGRSRDVPRFSARTLDLDLLLYDDLICHDGKLDLPRQDIMTCAFVLGPLAEIAGDVIHPETGERIRDIWASFDRAGQAIWPVDFNLDL